MVFILIGIFRPHLKNIMIRKITYCRLNPGASNETIVATSFESRKYDAAAAVR